LWKPAAEEQVSTVQDLQPEALISPSRFVNELQRMAATFGLAANPPAAP
jgi:hypothetical protein